ncbi:hypothetical protein KCU61_g241, partial [Aureobasidium melanogenum]
MSWWEVALEHDEESRRTITPAIVFHIVRERGWRYFDFVEGTIDGKQNERRGKDEHLNLRKLVVLDTDQTAQSRFWLPCICHTATRTVNLAQGYGGHQERKGLISCSKCVVKDIIHINKDTHVYTVHGLDAIAVSVCLAAGLTITASNIEVGRAEAARDREKRAQGLERDARRAPPTRPACPIHVWCFVNDPIARSHDVRLSIAGGTGGTLHAGRCNACCSRASRRREMRR